MRNSYAAKPFFRKASICPRVKLLLEPYYTVAQGWHWDGVGMRLSTRVTQETKMSR